MDIGDIIRLIFLAFIFLSFFGGLFGRKSGDEQEPRRVPRPVQPRSIEMPVPESAPPMMQEPARQVAQRPAPDRPAEGKTYDDAIEAGAATRRARLEAARKRYSHHRGEFLEQDVRMDVTPEHHRPPRSHPAVGARRHHPATGGDVLRRSLKDPDTLERAFIVKEVLDRPLGMRERR